jgi:hypothetical protein
MAKDFLKVYANPWLHVDHEGRPCCAVERTGSPEIAGEINGRWVGATPKVSVKGECITVGTLTGYAGADAEHEVTWDFSADVQLVPNFGAAGGYYRDRIREGALVLENDADAKRLGLKVSTGKSALAPDPTITAKPGLKKGQE